MLINRKKYRTEKFFDCANDNIEFLSKSLMISYKKMETITLIAVIYHAVLSGVESKQRTMADCLDLMERAKKNIVDLQNFAKAEKGNSAYYFGDSIITLQRFVEETNDKLEDIDGLCFNKSMLIDEVVYESDYAQMYLMCGEKDMLLIQLHSEHTYLLAQFDWICKIGELCNINTNKHKNLIEERDRELTELYKSKNII